MSGGNGDKKVNFQKVSFVKSAVWPEHYPPADRPEVAFAGRSNVGKSSLLNMLFQRRRLAKVSNTPGRTQTINFFDVDSKLYVVDLPGYGFAKVPKTERQKWKKMIEKYFYLRKNLVLCLLLLDIRREPSDTDLTMWKWGKELKLQMVPVITKIDKLKKNKRNIQLQKIAEALEVPKSLLIPTSAKDAVGREELRRLLENIVLSTS